MKKPKAFYIKRKDRTLVIRLAFRLRKLHRQGWGIFLVFGKDLDWTRYY